MAALVEPVLLAALVVFGAWAGLARIEPDPEIRARTGGLAGISAIAALAALAGLIFGPATAVAAWVPPLFAAQLAVAAWVDRQTAWVPDAVLFGLCLLALLAGAGQAASPFAALPDALVRAGMPLLLPLAAAAALVLVLAAAALWRLQLALGRGALTPPDLLAFTLPLLVFGFTGPAALVYALTGTGAAAVLWLPAVRRSLLHPAAAAEGARDLGLSGGQPVPALLLVLPPLVAVYLAAGGAG